MKDLRELNLYNLMLVTLYILKVIADKKIKRLRPRQVLPFAVLLNLFALASFAAHHNIYFYTAAVLLILSLSILPSTIQRKPSYHWVR